MTKDNGSNHRETPACSRDRVHEHQLVSGQPDHEHESDCTQNHAESYNHTCGSDHEHGQDRDHAHDSEHEHGHRQASEHHHDHAGSCAGHHHPVNVEDTSGPRLLLTLLLNLIIPIAQVIGGMYAHSMALISDATHNFSDFTAVLIAYIAYRIGRKGASVHNTFGYRRAEILAALINVAVLAGAVVFIVTQAVHRFRHPEVVSGQLVVWIAAIGVAGNGFSALLLHGDAKHSLNVRGAFLHMLGDLLTSVVVLLNGVVLMFKPWYWLDPALSILIVLFILKNCWTILKEASAILMNATPKGLDLGAVQRFLEELPEICAVHYLHAWNVSSSSIAFSCHVVVPEQPVSRTQALAETVRRHLMDRFKIDHPVLQFETTACGNGTMLCEWSCNPAQASAGLVRSRSEDRAPVRKWTLGLAAEWLARLVLGGVFLYAGVGKILHPADFAATIHNYQVLPDGVINLTALILPWLELFIGACLILGIWLPGSILLANLLLLTFVGALAYNAARNLDVACGCFETSRSLADRGHMLWYLVRDGLFLVPGFYLLGRCLIRGCSQSQNEGSIQPPA